MPTWNNNPITVDGITCGTKIYDISDRGQIKNCARECVVRMYLRGTNSDYFVTRLQEIRPKFFYDYLLTISVEDIQNNFFNVCSDVETYIVQNIRNKHIKNVELLIEQGEATVYDAVCNNAFNPDTRNAEIMIQDIFYVLNELHHASVVHADIKPDNFLYCRRGGNPRTLVLNDFDTSFVLPKGRTNITFNGPTDIIGITPRYSAPEQYGVYGYTIGHEADVFCAGLISYIMLNGQKHPKEYHRLNDAGDKLGFMKELFQNMNEDNTEFDLNAIETNTLLNDYIPKALKINPEKRPTAMQILDASRTQIVAPHPEQPTIEHNNPITPKPEHKPDNSEHKSAENVTVNTTKNSNNNNGNIYDDHSNHDDHSNNGIVIIAIVAIVAIAIAIVAIIFLLKFETKDNVMITNVSMSSGNMTASMTADTTQENTEAVTGIQEKIII